ncbi:DUF3887 domain-containing protein [Methanococcoides methylutens]|uniref:DUF3887 domain-containing protein n=1 Tax=Methanococcoides methylutens MM1 TaxID=1434104 RepID=A0A0E3X0Q5_METMT|nr:DUF3887 domain-containing protein [Methanococcoides methylutens]AKB85465.1 hypothetical protein MCMEM_1412 [Methanococcoides methylutens MM1]
MKLKIKALAGLIILAAIILSGCTSIDEESFNADIQGYAEPIAENALQALNEKNYTRFSADLDPTMKKAFTEEVFLKSADIIQDELGNYTSKELLEINTGEKHTVVVYQANFEKQTDDVILRLIFVNSEGQVELRGIWFESPQLKKRMALER